MTFCFWNREATYIFPCLILTFSTLYPLTIIRFTNIFLTAYALWDHTDKSIRTTTSCGFWSAEGPSTRHVIFVLIFIIIEIRARSDEITNQYKNNANVRPIEASPTEVASEIWVFLKNVQWKLRKIFEPNHNAVTHTYN